MKLTITIDVDGAEPTRVDPHAIAETLLDVALNDPNLPDDLAVAAEEAPGMITFEFVGAEWDS